MSHLAADGLLSKEETSNRGKLNYCIFFSVAIISDCELTMSTI